MKKYCREAGAKRKWMEVIRKIKRSFVGFGCILRRNRLQQRRILKEKVEEKRGRRKMSECLRLSAVQYNDNTVHHCYYKLRCQVKPKVNIELSNKL